MFPARVILLLSLWATSANAQIIRPRFDWPVGSSAEVHVLYNLFTTREGRDTSKTIIESRYELTVGASDEGRILHWSPPESQGSAPTTENPLPLSEQLFLPSFLVTAEGGFAGLHATKEFRRRVRHDTLRARLTDQRLPSTAQELWAPLVMNWIGSELELGRAAQTRQSRPVPVLPGATVDLIVTIGAESHVSCGAKLPGDTSCVRIFMDAAADTAQMAEVLRRIAPPTDSAVRSYTVQRSVTLVTDPTRLLPYELELVHELRTVILEPGRPPQASGAVKASRWIFQWSRS
jgi:hypothetical protein